ncbi:hypothetical protein [Candidatus Sororendozoicomonas aggregata]|uniref:hypothetical protein n=1 Tax=Candidatus Sororendozoicomonas aggregata TaxID=3073239 RepID=UPI002ED29CFA
MFCYRARRRAVSGSRQWLLFVVFFSLTCWISEAHPMFPGNREVDNISINSIIEMSKWSHTSVKYAESVEQGLKTANEIDGKKFIEAVDKNGFSKKVIDNISTSSFSEDIRVYLKRKSILQFSRKDNAIKSLVEFILKCLYIINDRVEAGDTEKAFEYATTLYDVSKKDDYWCVSRGLRNAYTFYKTGGDEDEEVQLRDFGSMRVSGRGKRRSPLSPEPSTHHSGRTEAGAFAYPPEMNFLSTSGGSPINAPPPYSPNGPTRDIGFETLNRDCSEGSGWVGGKIMQEARMPPVNYAQPPIPPKVKEMSSGHTVYPPFFTSPSPYSSHGPDTGFYPTLTGSAFTDSVGKQPGIEEIPVQDSEEIEPPVNYTLGCDLDENHRFSVLLKPDKGIPLLYLTKREMHLGEIPKWIKDKIKSVGEENIFSHDMLAVITFLETIAYVDEYLSPHYELHPQIEVSGKIGSSESEAALKENVAIDIHSMLGKNMCEQSPGSFLVQPDPDKDLSFHQSFELISDIDEVGCDKGITLSRKDLAYQNVTNDHYWQMLDDFKQGHRKIATFVTHIRKQSQDDTAACPPVMAMVPENYDAAMQSDDFAVMPKEGVVHIIHLYVWAPGDRNFNLDKKAALEIKSYFKNVLTQL